ncbi:RNA polymerase subunit sigma-70 [Sphingomonas oleivorans]|uniref:RNA polymerase subunit sigma-70 n=1 Tax=Sphingomonas oleivorans TaxID=1735121 RepID=A0A2T5FUK5_9SPHN|nr:RNA polymerase sigma factor [Sphingomonas oleivorans]PTQ08210.1 RNA polymerase subunit sigma-70 [Sphingomonas oleivorans]
MTQAGLEALFLANRARLLRFIIAHGGGDQAEDLLQELWLRIAAAQPGPIAQPLSYLYRAANNLMLDRYRSAQYTARRERDWSDANGATVPGISDEPSGERAMIAREQLRIAEQRLATLGARAAAIFRRHRIDGASQRQIAAEMGVSLSTVESDLRKSYRAMIDLQKDFDEA